MWTYRWGAISRLGVIVRRRQFNPAYRSAELQRHSDCLEGKRATGRSAGAHLAKVSQTLAEKGEGRRWRGGRVGGGGYKLVRSGNRAINSGQRQERLREDKGHHVLDER